MGEALRDARVTACTRRMWRASIAFPSGCPACYHVRTQARPIPAPAARGPRLCVRWQRNMEGSQYWLDQQAIERLAQHIPFESDPMTKAECIEMLRGIVLRSGPHIDRSTFGFEAAESLR